MRDVKSYVLSLQLLSQCRICSCKYLSPQSLLLQNCLQLHTCSRSAAKTLLCATAKTDGGFAATQSTFYRQNCFSLCSGHICSWHLPIVRCITRDKGRTLSTAKCSIKPRNLFFHETRKQFSVLGIKMMSERFVRLVCAC